MTHKVWLIPREQTGTPFKTLWPAGEPEPTSEDRWGARVDIQAQTHGESPTDALLMTIDKAIEELRAFRALVERNQHDDAKWRSSYQLETNEEGE